MSNRFSHTAKYKGVAKNGRWTGVVLCHHAVLDEPLHWRKPRRVFVCSMSDLFHSNVSFDFICQVFNVMRLADQHVFQVLTKRPGRMKHFANEVWPGYCRSIGAAGIWPSNVWAGTSLEQERDGNKNLMARLALLSDVPAKIRFVSAEPLLGPLDLTNWLTCRVCRGDRTLPVFDPVSMRVTGESACPQCHGIDRNIHWVIAGSESGPNARHMDLDWVRDIRDQCQDAGTSFFLKQMMVDGKVIGLPLLDGIRHGAFPETAHTGNSLIAHKRT